MQLINNLKAANAATVQVKSFKQVEAHRGVAWSCTVYMGGKKLGMVSNTGTGGMTRFDFNENQQKEVVERLKRFDYVLQLQHGELTVTEPTDIEGWLELAIGQIGDEMAELKSYKRRMKGGVYVEKRTEPVFAFIKGEDTPARRKAIKAHYGEDLVCFLNEQFAEL